MRRWLAPSRWSAVLGILPGTTCCARGPPQGVAGILAAVRLRQRDHLVPGETLGVPGVSAKAVSLWTNRENPEIKVWGRSSKRGIGDQDHRVKGRRGLFYDDVAIKTYSVSKYSSLITFVSVGGYLLKGSNSQTQPQNSDLCSCWRPSDAHLAAVLWRWGCAGVVSVAI